jgi:two-component system, chemotaxis family, sensor kinase CheA
VTGKDEAFLKRLLATFQIEANEHIAAMASGLVALEENPSVRRRAELIEAVFREAHSMKGAARSVNLPLIETLCQSIESVVAAMKRRELAPERSLFDPLHRALDQLGVLTAGAGTETVLTEKAQARALIGELNDTLGNRLRQRPEAEVPVDEVPPDTGEATMPAPVVAAAVSDSMRISKSRLDALLLQAEAFLSVKQMLARQASELRAISSNLTAIERDARQHRSQLHAAKAAMRAKNGGTPAISPSRDRSRWMDHLEAQEDRISTLSHTFAHFERAAAQDHRTIEAMVDGLMDSLKSVSMLPFSSLLDLFPKLVRDLSHDREKKAVLTIRGGGIEIDKRILDEMREPLIHLVRNCMDHGIETPTRRAARNKPAAGRISMDVSHWEGSSVQLVVSDDGSGIDVSRIIEAASKAGIFPHQEAEALDEGELLQLIFRSGLTTSPIITDLSGRGLGLAIVKERVEKLGGRISCETRPGEGATFRILLPLTLSSLRGVLVRIDAQRFLIPTAGVERTLRVSRDEIKTVENRETLAIGDAIVPLVSLGEILELPAKVHGTASGFTAAVVLGTGNERIAFGVDEVLDEREVLAKDLGSQLVRVRNVAAATILGVGEVVPILNMADLMRSALRVSSMPRTAHAAQEPERRSAILVVEDSITSRTLLKNILKLSGYDVATAVDGADGLATLKSGAFDLVVSDVDMPRMNGFELTAQIRADKRLAELPVVLVTALDSREDRERGIDVGANAYIVKSSFDKGNLLEAVKRLVG